MVEKRTLIRILTFTFAPKTKARRLNVFNFFKLCKKSDEKNLKCARLCKSVDLFVHEAAHAPTYKIFLKGTNACRIYFIRIKNKLIFYWRAWLFVFVCRGTCSAIWFVAWLYGIASENLEYEWSLSACEFPLWTLKRRQYEQIAWSENSRETKWDKGRKKQRVEGSALRKQNKREMEPNWKKNNNCEQQEWVKKCRKLRMHSPVCAQLYIRLSVCWMSMCVLDFQRALFLAFSLFSFILL